MTNLNSEFKNLIQLVNEHPNYGLVYYSGEWIVYDENNDLTDIKLNTKLMNTLEDLGLLSFQRYFISHRSVREYKLVLFHLKDTILRIHNLLQFLIEKTKDVNIKSLRQLIGLINGEEYKIFSSKSSMPVSYWGGSRDVMALYFYINNASANNFIMKFPYYMVSNLHNDSFNKGMQSIYNTLFE